MKYTKEERMDIGQRLYNRELSMKEAMVQFGIPRRSASRYMQEYRDANNLPGRRRGRPSVADVQDFTQQKSPPDFEELQSMSKEDLIKEVMRARIREARLKKGYEVKGDGSVIVYDNKNTK